MCDTREIYSQSEARLINAFNDPQLTRIQLGHEESAVVEGSVEQVDPLADRELKRRNWTKNETKCYKERRNQSNFSECSC